MALSDGLEEEAEDWDSPEADGERDSWADADFPSEVRAAALLALLVGVSSWRGPLLTRAIPFVEVVAASLVMRLNEGSFI